MKTSTCRDGTLKTRWEWHHNTFAPSLHLAPFYGKNRNVVVTKICCFSWMFYPKMLLWVSYLTTTSKIVPCMGDIQCSREYRKFLKSISIHFNCSFMQLKQQTSSHNNIPLLGVIHAHRKTLYMHLGYSDSLNEQGTQHCNCSLHSLPHKRQSKSTMLSIATTLQLLTT